ncbi:MAG TPA: Na+/H+ antiporter NhaA, partial [Sandaracinaceae bacterium LLY-WYZ-13_1]|nr:Na+/H+ antiporter NhaA [Sandaracinaceae bacterium LLY-WYZ-13_1]
RPIDRLTRPFMSFIRHKLAGAALLMAGAAVAVVWANSPWAHSYHHLLETPVSVGFASATLEKSLHHWINDGLMGIFFFLVGLEIKREVLAGELSSVRKATLPAVAALGGMVAPAAFYYVLNPTGPGQAGWGIPMATDIAFALGVLALLGDRCPLGLKVFLTALAIVDDIGAVLVIAIFYTDSLSVISLVSGLAFFSLAIGANLLRVRDTLVYFGLGTLCWLMFLQSGVHATIAALLMAFTIPARTRIDGEDFFARATDELADLRRVGVPQDTELNTNTQQHILDRMEKIIGEASAPLSKLEHALNPLVTFLVLPVFALANAGVSLGGDLGAAFTDTITLGILAGLFLGKQLGITSFAWIAVKLRVADLPRGVRWSHVHGAAVLGGIGFTMSLFIAGLAFAGDDAALEHAKLAILSASVLCGVLGYFLVWRAARAFRRRAEERAPAGAEAESQAAE